MFLDKKVRNNITQYTGYIRIKRLKIYCLLLLFFLASTAKYPESRKNATTPIRPRINLIVAPLSDSRWLKKTSRIAFPPKCADPIQLLCFFHSVLPYILQTQSSFDCVLNLFQFLFSLCFISALDAVIDLYFRFCTGRPYSNP